MNTDRETLGYERVLDEALRHCESEPIHIPGSIQPHGVLLGIDPIDFKVLLATENVAEYLGLAPEEALGSNLARLAGRSMMDRIERLMVSSDLSDPHRFLAPIDRDGAEWLAEASVHRQGSILVLELERADLAGVEVKVELSRWIRLFSPTPGGASSLVQSLQSVAAEARVLGGYDRTMVYRFHPDDHGEVIAESARPDLDPFLGMHYPASDIPRQARELYLRSRVRVLVDVHARAVPLSTRAGLSPAGPLDMTSCQLRSVSPVHLEYLDNMGVQATLVTSILQGDRLWGLLVCHHYQGPRKPSQSLRAACNFLSEVISVEVAAHEGRDHLRAQSAASDLQRRILATVRDHSNWMDRILDRPESCRSPIPSSGLAIVEGSSVRGVGTVPDEATIRQICAWIDRNHPGPIFSTEALGGCEPAFAGIEAACGVLAVEISPVYRTHLIWFRQEFIREVTWGGDPSKGLVIGEEGARLSPRKSFDAWSSTVRGRSSPWGDGDLIAAREIRASVIEVVMIASLLQKADSEIELMRTRWAVEATSEAILIADAKGRPVFVNHAFTELFRTRLDELPEYSVCAPIGDLVRGEEILAATLLGGTWRGEVEMPGPEGEPIPVALGVDSVVNETGVVLGSIAIHFDLTERHRARRELEEHARRLEEAKARAVGADRAKGEFLANMSHEIRTPMNGVIGLTDLVLQTDLTPVQREHLDLIKSSADSLMTLIDDILDFSKIEAGKLALDPVPFDLRDAITDTLRGLAIRAHAKGLELTGRVAPDLPGSVIGDAGRLRQVLVNLVGNAIKFTEAGEVSVSVEGVEEGRALGFVVADTGIGIPAAKRAAIFAPFEQADGSTTRKYGGTGLGLTISRRLVELMGGRIWVEENPGGGSVFLFTARLDPGPVSPPLPHPGRLAGLAVLIVDDNRTSRLILEEELSRWGFRVAVAPGGTEALTALAGAVRAGEPFELVLLDRMMPDMDGLELAGHVRRDPALAGVKILMLTSGGSDESGRYSELGIGGWLSKPICHSELFKAVLGLVGPTGQSPAVAVSARVEAGPSPAGRRLRILLAEDHPINQKVAARMLEGLGHEVTLVGDGRAAVEASGVGAYDVILMDVQMPVMDGFEATAAIRRREEGSDQHVPIVALTAHAMAGDRERCLGSGFDDYLSKPLRAATLRESLNRLDGPGVALLEAKPGEVADDRRAFDRRAALENLGGDEGLLDEIVGLFLDDCPRQLESIRIAVVARDLAALGRLAHTVSGVASNFAAEEVVASARRIEVMAGSGDLAGAGAAGDELGRAVDRFRIAALATGVGGA
ncbi:response regulator [Paludisphaera mucosa]|uniref:histidine kinase n=1 Tax=Paludisphaera mucosa TaxID=3030827 RepID=A0ABT6FEC8_9BACT|nr:response regulator [Paludisphaera mucosa]MDG3005882.1 response regulator [Paludisphaera mucosa]